MKFGLPPIAAPDARLFILGSLPGDASLAAQRYYAHPSNQFWRLVGAALKLDLQSLAYEERLTQLAAHKVGLWDVIASASRPGSLDQAIRDAEQNPLIGLLDDYPAVHAIAFNGATAARIGTQALSHAKTRPHLIALPSSSAANTTAFAEKARAWSELRNWAGAKSLHQA